MPGLPRTPRSPCRNPPRPGGGNVYQGQFSPSTGAGGWIPPWASAVCKPCTGQSPRDGVALELPLLRHARRVAREAGSPGCAPDNRGPLVRERSLAIRAQSRSLTPATHQSGCAARATGQLAEGARRMFRQATIQPDGTGYLRDMRRPNVPPGCGCSTISSDLRRWYVALGQRSPVRCANHTKRSTPMSALTRWILGLTLVVLAAAAPARQAREATPRLRRPARPATRCR